MTIQPGTVLAAIAEAGSVLVNSLHHQGVRAAGKGQRVVARGADGLIEAIEAEPDVGAPVPFLLGVQWHPEKQREDFSDRLFRAFVDAARGKATARAKDAAR